MKQKILNGILDQADSRIGNDELISLPLMQDNPMVAIPMTNQGQGNRIEVI